MALMSANPSISVLITLYNHERYIQQAVESALSQTLVPDEIIIIDDGSTDRSPDIVRSLQYPSVKFIEQPYNLGGVTTVRGLLACKGSLIAILNSDDAWEPDKLERQAAYLEAHQRCDVVFTRPVLMDSGGTRIARHEHYLYDTFYQPDRSRTEWLRYLYLHGNAFCASSALIRRRCIDELGPLDARYVQLQDFEMWLRIAISGKDLHVLEEPLTLYRVMRSQLSAISGGTVVREGYEHAKALQNFWSIKSAADLWAVFPEMNSGREPDDRLILFYLAMFSRGQMKPYYRQFAIETFFEMAKDEAAMKCAAETLGFTHADYRRYMAESSVGRDTHARNSWLRRLLWMLPPWLVQRLRRARGVLRRIQ